MEKFLPALVSRFPLYSYAHSTIDLSEILKDEKFKTAILLASRPFFEELSKKDFVYELLSEKQKHSLRKYFNRAMFRSTPFGLFSSFSVAQWGQGNHSEALIASEPSADIRLDFGLLQNLWDLYLKNERGTAKYFPNSSFRYSRFDYRYYKKLVQWNNCNFSMVSLDKNYVLKNILKYCEQGRTYDEVVAMLDENSQVQSEEAGQFIDQLIEEQILVAGTSPNVTGRDYNDLFIKYLGANSSNNFIKEKLIENIHRLSVPPNDTDKLFLHSKLLNDYLSKENDVSHFYAVSSRAVISGSLTTNYQQHIEEGLQCLNVLCKENESAELKKFKVAFKKKYESREVPLLEALDPQFGIGYGDFDKLKINYGFASSYMSTSNQKEPSEFEDELTILIKELQVQKDFGEMAELEITDKHLRRMSPKKAKEKMPPSLSVMFRTLGDRIFIESAGGASALSLIGRFAYSPKVYAHAKQIATLEQQLNSDVVFAEIAYNCSLHTSNINRRPHFYEYEIPVLTNSVLPVEKQIPLNDILLSVLDETVILRSRKLGTRVIPRHSSAFNYTKSSFPVFRFLCDVQNQGIKTNFGFSLSHLLPGLQFYPRVRYKSCVLQLAEWHIDSFQLKPLQDMPEAETLCRFQQWARDLRLPRYFSYNVSDNFLVIDSSSYSDVAMFLNEVKNKEEIILKEFPFLELPATAKNAAQDPLLAQHIASVYHPESTYNVTKEMGANLVDFKDQQTKDWVYYKIYCHPLSSNSIITKHLLPLIRKLIVAKQIKEQWFWIRYNDPDYHIRLRINARKSFRKSVLNELNFCLEEVCRQLLANHFQNDVYNREAQRYSFALIEGVESVFAASSLIVASWLEKNKTLSYEDETVLIEAVAQSYCYLNYFEIEGLELIDFCKQQFDLFFEEAGGTRLLKSELETLYREKMNQILARLEDCEKSKKFMPLREGIKNLRIKHQTKRIQSPSIHQLARDLIHMHLNRLFVVNQRHFEMVTYFLLYRSLNAQWHKSRVQ